MLRQGVGRGGISASGGAAGSVSLVSGSAASAAGAALTVFRHKIAALFRKNRGIEKHREIHLKNGWENLFEVSEKQSTDPGTNKKKTSDKKNTVTKQKMYSVTEDLYQ